MLIKENLAYFAQPLHGCLLRVVLTHVMQKIMAEIFDEFDKSVTSNLFTKEFSQTNRVQSFY